LQLAFCARCLRDAAAANSARLFCGFLALLNPGSYRDAVFAVRAADVGLCADGLCVTLLPALCYNKKALWCAVLFVSGGDVLVALFCGAALRFPANGLRTSRFCLTHLLAVSAVAPFLLFPAIVRSSAFLVRCPGWLYVCHSDFVTGPRLFGASVSR